MQVVEKLRNDREETAASFMQGRCSIADFCIAFDEIGKLSVDYCLMASVYQICKYFVFSYPHLDDIAELLDRETSLTRFMLKCMIERLTTHEN